MIYMVFASVWKPLFSSVHGTVTLTLMLLPIVIPADEIMLSHVVI